MVNYTTEFLKECVVKYEQQEVKKIQQESNFQLVFTDDSVYDLDKIILLRRRDVGNTPSSIHVVETDDDNYADQMLVFLAIDHLLFNTDTAATYTYEQNEFYRELQQVVTINNIVTYKPYDSITEVPNYIAKLKSVLDPDINGALLQTLYEQIPSQIREKDGFVQINTSGDDNFFDILDIFDPDDIL